MIRYFYKFLLLLVVISYNTGVHSQAQNTFSTLAPISGLEQLDLTLEELRTYEKDLLEFLDTSDNVTFRDIYLYLQKKNASGISPETLSLWLSETICDTKIIRIFNLKKGKIYESFQPYEKTLLTQNCEWTFISLEDLDKADPLKNLYQETIHYNITNFDMISGGRVGVFNRDTATEDIKRFFNKTKNSPVLERSKILQIYRGIINHASDTEKKELDNQYQVLINVMERLHYYIDEFKDQQTEIQKRIELIRAFKIANKMAKNKADMLSVIASLLQFSPPELLKSFTNDKDAFITYDQFKIIKHKINQSTIIRGDRFFSEYVQNPEKYMQRDRKGELITKGHALQNYFHMLISESATPDGEADPDIMIMVILTELESIKDDSDLKGEKLDRRIEYLIPLAESLGGNLIADKLRDIQIQRNHKEEYQNIKQAIQNVFGLSYETLYSTLYGSIVPKLENRLQEEFPDYKFKIRARIKSISSLRKKIHKHAKAKEINLDDPDNPNAMESIINELFDIIGLQVVFDIPEYIRKNEDQLNKEQKKLIDIIQDEFSEERTLIRIYKYNIKELKKQNKPLNNAKVKELKKQITILETNLANAIRRKKIKKLGYSEMNTQLTWSQNKGMMRGEFQVISSYDLSLYKYGADAKNQKSISHFLYKLREAKHIFDLELLEKLAHQFNDDYHHNFNLLFNEIKKYVFVKVAVRNEKEEWYFKYLRLPKGAIAAGAAAARTITSNIFDKYHGHALIKKYYIEDDALHFTLEEQNIPEERQLKNGDSLLFYKTDKQLINKKIVSTIMSNTKRIRAILRAILIVDKPVSINIEDFKKRLADYLGKDTEVDKIISNSLNRFHLKSNEEFYQMLYHINHLDKVESSSELILAIAQRFFEDSLEIKDPIETIEDLKKSLNIDDTASHLEIMATLVAANFLGRRIIEKKMKNVSIDNKYGKKEPLSKSWQEILHKFLIKQTEISSKEILYNRLGLGLISQEEILMNIHRANEFKYMATAPIQDEKSVRAFMFKLEDSGFHILRYHTDAENNITTFYIVNPVIFSGKYIAKPADMNTYADKLVKDFETHNKGTKIRHQYRIINLLIHKHPLIASSDIIDKFNKCNLKITDVKEGLLIEAPSKCNIEILKNHLIEKYKPEYSEGYLQSSININSISSNTAEDILAQAA